MSKEEDEARSREIAEFAYAHPELTLSSIGRRFGLSRQRVQQIATRDPVRYAARKVRKPPTQAHHLTKTCTICGKMFKGPLIKYCSEDHRQVSYALRYHTDEEYREAQKKRVASWVLKYPDRINYDDAKRREQIIASAQRVVDDAPVQRRGRWLTAGSKAMDRALEAYRNEWPIFDKLHPDIQAQIKRIDRNER